ncbi:MAG: hypothetical protein ACTH32_06430 [Microbacterium gubbeenense]|uniref:hypothetical protein n=1 Tax=Microbacterium gubbeenense TaxID=159896 RepID=UPI003F9A8C79
MTFTTVESLINLDTQSFTQVVTDDLSLVGNAHGPFQDAKVIDRTYGALVERLSFVNETLAHKAEDPNVTPIEYARTQRFRRHIIAVLNTVERQMTWQQGVKAKQLSRWKDLLHKICDEIEGDEEFDDILDDADFQVPYGAGPGQGTFLSLRDWVAIRRIKDPSRVQQKHEDIEEAA